MQRFAVDTAVRIRHAADVPLLLRGLYGVVRYQKQTSDAVTVQVKTWTGRWPWLSLQSSWLEPLEPDARARAEYFFANIERNRATLQERTEFRYAWEGIQSLLEKYVEIGDHFWLCATLAEALATYDLAGKLELHEQDLLTRRYAQLTSYHQKLALRAQRVWGE